MTYPSCIELSSIEASCASHKKVGGATSFFYIGSKKLFYDNGVASAVPNLEYSTEGWKLNYNLLTETGLNLAKFECVILKNTGGFETVAGENVNSFTHSITCILYYKSAVELKRINDLLDAEDLIVFLPTNASDVKIYGIEKGQIYSPNGVDKMTDKLGLKAATGTGADIVELQGEVGVAVTLTSVNMLTLPALLYYVYDVDGGTELFGYPNLVDVLDILSAENN